MSEDWKSLYEEEYRTVDLCWKALGIATYEQAKGKAIFEIIAEQRASRADLLALLIDLRDHGYTTTADHDRVCAAIRRATEE